MGYVLLNYKNIQKLSICVALGATLMLASCFNGAPPPTGGSSGRSAASTATLPTGSSEGAFTLVKVVRSNQDPTNLLELLTANNELATFCPALTDCKCRFNWLETNGVFREVEQDLGYVETNMARCLFTQVSTNVPFFDVRLVVSSGGSASAPYRVNMNTQNPSFNPSLNSNYVPIQRYMCRDSIRKTNNTGYYSPGGAGGGNLLDPRLWDMGYALNFYTSSFGLDYGATASGGTLPTGWECPPIPNDASFSAVFDLKIYSVAPISIANPLLTNVVTGDNTIFPSNDNLNNTSVCITGNESGCEQYKINRHDYFLSGFQDGTFKMPVCMVHKVANLVSNTLNCIVDATKGPAKLGSAALASGGQDIVGFAAVPDANQNCPNTNAVAIPAGKKWAKLWKFRASLPIRSIQDVANPNDIGALWCTNRKQECVPGSTQAGGATASVCWSAGAGGVSTGTGPKIGPQAGVLTGTAYGNCRTTGSAGDNQSPFATTTTNYTAGACISGDENCCMDHNRNTGGTVANRRPANYTPGGDYCTPSLVGSNSALSAGGVALDNWLLSGANRRPCIEADTDANGKFAMSFPDPLGTYLLSARSLDSNSRPDEVYIVSPPSVTIENMQNPSDPVGQQYIPKRFLPNSATPVVYGFEAGSQNSNDPAQRVSMFPVCVLQDTK